MNNLRELESKIRGWAGEDRVLWGTGDAPVHGVEAYQGWPGVYYCTRWKDGQVVERKSFHVDEV